MAIPTEIASLDSEEYLTPKHSIPPNIHSLTVSGSKGHFSNFYLESPLDPILPESVHDQLFKDAASRSVAREKLKSYAELQREKETQSYKSDKKLSAGQSSELFLRLNKEGEARQERLKISQKIKEYQEAKQLKQPEINKSSFQPQKDVVSRLLDYGKRQQLKNEERIREKKEREEEEIKNTFSVHKRVFSELSSSSQIFATGKDSSFVSNRGMKSSNSPDKVIQKIKNLGRDRNLRPKSSNFIVK